MYQKEISIVHGCVCRHMITALISVRGFSGEYNYHSVDVKGTEFTSVAVPLIYMAAGLQNTIIQV